MAVVRHEEQQYNLIADLVAETLAPTDNDVVYVEELKRAFRWVAGETAVADNRYIIEQTSETANGRWVADGVANISTGTANSDALGNGQSSVFDITATGALAADANVIAVTNASAFPANVFVTSKEVIADDTVRVTLENQSGGAIAAQAVNVSVLGF